MSESFVTDQFVALELTPEALLANDSDDDGDALTLSIVRGPTVGVLTIQADGSLLYSPSDVFDGVDTFEYVVSDGLVFSDPVEVQIVVEPLGIAPPAPSGAPSDGGDSGSAGEQSPPPPTQVTVGVPESPNSANATPSNDSNDEEIDAVPMNRRSTATAVAPEASTSNEQVDVVTVSTSEQESNQTAQNRRINDHVSRISRTLEAMAPTTDRYDFVVDAFVSTPLSLAPFDSSSSASALNQPGFEFKELAVGTTAITTTTLSVGYVIWLIRGGSLLASFVSAMPAWTAFDPLAVVNYANEEKDGESLLDIVRNRKHQDSQV